MNLPSTPIDNLTHQRSRATARRIALLLAVLLAVLAPFGATRQAAAHASLDGSTPTDGAVLTEVPAEIVLRFNEDVTPLGSSTLTGPTEVSVEGRQTETGDVRFTPDRRLGDGTWLLSWRVVSADGHPIGGAIRFTVDTGNPSPPEVAPQPEIAPQPDAGTSNAAMTDASAPGVDWQDRVLETLTWFGIVIGVAGHIARRRRTRQIGAALAILAAGVRLVEMIDTHRGVAWEIGETRSTAAMLIAGALLTIPGGTAALAAAMVTVGLSATQSGHPLRLEPSWLYTGAHALHLAAALLWAAAVTATLLVPTEVRRASRMATIAVVALLPAGTLSAVGLLAGGDTAARWDRLMLTKLLLVAGALVLGAISHFALSRAHRNEDRVSTAGTSRGLRARSAIELAVIVAVAVLSAALTTTTPSRFQLEAARDRTPPTAETATTGTGATTETNTTAGTGATTEQSTAVTKDATLEVRFEDGSRGSLHLIGPDGIAPGAEVTMHLGIVDQDGSTLDAEQVEYAFIDTDGGTGTNGTMTTGTVNQAETVIPGPGTWRILFTVTRGFTETIGEASLAVEGSP